MTKVQKVFEQVVPFFRVLYYQWVRITGKMPVPLFLTCPFQIQWMISGLFLEGRALSRPPRHIRFFPGHDGAWPSSKTAFIHFFSFVIYLRLFLLYRLLRMDCFTSIL